MVVTGTKDSRIAIRIDSIPGVPGDENASLAIWD
jgi:hypothetical protein